MVLCAVFGCNNDSRRSKSVSYFKITSRSDEIQKIWVHFLKRKNYTLTKHSSICSEHFTEDSFLRDLQAELLNLKRQRKLCETAVPTIYNYNPSTIPVIVDVNRPSLKRRAHTESRLQAKHRKDEVEKILSESGLQREDTAEPAIELDNEGLSIGQELPQVQCNMSVQTDFIVFPQIMPSQSPLRATASTQTATNVKDVGTQCDDDDIFVSTYGSAMEIHSYCTTKENRIDNLFSPSTPTKTVPLKTSTPLKSLANTSLISTDTASTHESSLHLSTHDISYVPETSDQSSTSLSDSDPINTSDSKTSSLPHEDSKYIVFYSSLMELFKTCQKCCDPIINVQKSTTGTLLKLTSTCLSGHVFTWNSQPFISKMPAGNLLVAASILYTGCSLAQISNFAETLNLNFFGLSTFYKIQCSLFQIVNEAWLNERQSVQRQLHGKPLTLSGDGRCDSPGFSAKYCTYSLLDSESGKLVDFDVIHVGEVNYKSTNMEKEGLSRCLQRVSENLSINVLATDRHIQVGSMMKKQFPDIIHQFDVWHVSKAIIKKLTEKAKSKECEVLWHWISSIKNHFWWSVATCDGNLELLKEKWTSVMHHCVNVHKWSSNNQFHSCAHEPLTKMEQKKKKWLKPSSAAFLAVQAIVFDNSILKSLERLTLFCHTGDLEVYHSMMLKYCPKRQHFSYDGMVARTQLAALDHNHNTGREQATSTQGPSEGELRYNQVFPKRCKTWVAKPIPEKKCHSYRKDLMSRTVEVRMKAIQLPPLIKPTLPKNIANMDKPPKQETINSHRSRMSKSIRN